MDTHLWRSLFSELTNMAVLTEEVGELARVMSRRYGDQSFKAGENQDPADEMADVLWVLLVPRQSDWGESHGSLSEES